MSDTAPFVADAPFVHVCQFLRVPVVAGMVDGMFCGRQFDVLHGHVECGDGVVGAVTPLQLLLQRVAEGKLKGDAFARLTAHGCDQIFSVIHSAGILSDVCFIVFDNGRRRNVK